MHLLPFLSTTGISNPTANMIPQRLFHSCGTLYALFPTLLVSIKTLRDASNHSALSPREAHYDTPNPPFPRTPLLKFPSGGLSLFLTLGPQWISLVLGPLCNAPEPLQFHALPFARSPRDRAHSSGMSEDELSASPRIPSPLTRPA